MKQIALSSLIILCVFVLSSCKKGESVSPGLLSLVNPSAKNYCVLVINDFKGGPLDTVVWEDTKGDNFSPNYAACSVITGEECQNVYNTVTPAKGNFFSMFQVELSIPDAAFVNANSCSWMPELVYTGNRKIKAGRVSFAIQDPFGFPMSTCEWEPQSNVASFNILKVTPVNGDNCNLRAQATVHDAQFMYFGCKVPPYQIVDGIVQMDFKIN